KIDVLIDNSVCSQLLFIGLTNAVGISNISNTKALSTYQIAMAWVANKQPLFYDQIPIFMYKYIKKVVNVNGDGKYRYRAVAVGLGRNENEPFYQSLFLANDDYDIILKEISWESSPCT
ncbi:15188_t:CDS:1, partial [Dentiscutata heterogama]